MDEDQSQAGAGVDASQNGGDRTPEQVQAEIEQTRADLGETVEALAAKTDVKAQAKQAVDGAKATVSDTTANIKDTVTAKKDDFSSAAQNAAPASADEARLKLSGFAQSHRTALIAASAGLLGVVIGRRRSR